MTSAVEQLKLQMNPLTASERAELAYYLLTSLEPEEDGAAEAWDVEITRRLTEIREGTATGRPMDEVVAELRKTYP